MSNSFRESSIAPIIACSVAYPVAFAVAWLVWDLLPEYSLIWRTLLADIAATLVIFASGTILRNSSMYDPYWSLQPIVIGVVWLNFAFFPDGSSARANLVLALVILWGLRLTYNCFRRWEGLHHEDFRYLDFRRDWGNMYWFVDMFGIQLLPTILVFAGCLPLFPVLTGLPLPIGPIDLLAFVVTGGAIAVETVADQNLAAYLRSSPEPGSVCKRGLWQYSRHPNYFGEIAFWWGLWLFAIAADPTYWWTGVGALAITLLFVFASIPMMETRKRFKRPDYDHQVVDIPVLVPWPRKLS